MRLFAQQCEEGGSADSEHPPLPYFTNEKTEASRAMRISSKVAHWEAESGFQPGSLCHLRCLTGQPPTRVRPATASGSILSPPSQGLGSHPLHPWLSPVPWPRPSVDSALVWPHPPPKPQNPVHSPTSAPPFPFLALPLPGLRVPDRRPPPLTPNQFPFFSLGLPAPPLPLKPRPSRPRPRTAPFSLEATRALSRSI